MSQEQSRTVALASIVVLVVLVVRTRAMDWLGTMFTYVQFNWDFNPLDWGSSTSSPSSSSSGSSGSVSSSSGFASSAAYQPGPGGQGGTFQGASGATYSGSYASLTDAQKKDVNDYAHQQQAAAG